MQQKSALQGFWLDFCTKQVVSARACAYQVLPYNSSGITLFGKKTVQADSCFDSEEIGTLLISVEGKKGGFGGGASFWARGPKFTRVSEKIFYKPPGEPRTKKEQKKHTGTVRNSFFTRLLVSLKQNERTDKSLQAV
jgi:hypothetical protein